MSNDSTQGTGPQLRRRQLAASRSLGDVFIWGGKSCGKCHDFRSSSEILHFFCGNLGVHYPVPVDSVHLM